jgi:hypothetical protein
VQRFQQRVAIVAADLEGALIVEYGHVVAG